MSAPITLSDGSEIVELLEPPELDSAEDIQDLINDAGVEVMAVDWVFQQIAGRSLVEAVIMPITGDFTKIAGNAEAWRTIAEAMKQFGKTMTENASAVGEQWTGAASLAHEAYVDIGWRAGLAAEAGIATAIAKGFDALSDASKKLAAKALDLLKKLVDKLIEIAVKACIPVAGWALEATTILDAIEIFNMILEIIEMIKDIIEKVGDLWDSVKDIGSQLAKIKDVKGLGDLTKIVTDVAGDVKDIKGDVKGIKDKAKEIGTTAAESGHDKKDSGSSSHEKSHSDSSSHEKPASHEKPDSGPPAHEPPATHDKPKTHRSRSGRISGHI
ncbi:WXG100 family type VII secretion target [Amycolatopsis sp. H20-H5]|uniref:WXG100 family type VII secretion target n=1 Tax=Amycolatopsis sp. H20-H5 TaxID=3046309 RepID=UPI002DC01D8F|nr:hypothetical protein [Amycolatopsis sp. H20-H5]MEC3980029.1 hypothetical protein [Amycolatopsis sp. H20-H5]